MMKRFYATAFALAAVIGFGSMSFAQDSNTKTTQVDQREENQQKHIADGLKDGSINSREAVKLEKEEAKIERDEAAAKADGVVTKRERARLNRELNRSSRDIHQARRRTPGIDDREEGQQNRIARGLKNGSITSQEAARLEKEEAKIERDEAAAKADGVVTKRERTRLNHELDHTSRDIHRARHNGQRQH